MKQKKLREAVDDIEFYRSRYSLKERLSRRTLPVVALIVVLVIAAAIFTNIQNKKVAQTWSVIKEGDALYADSDYVHSKTRTQILTYRLIHPWNKTDIMKLDTPDWIKTKLIAQLDTSEEAMRPFMLSSDLVFMKDSMYKYGHTLLGKYVKRDSTAAEWIPDSVKLTPSPEKWYAIKPNRVIGSNNFQMDIPANYVLVDDLYYVRPVDVIATESLKPR